MDSDFTSLLVFYITTPLRIIHRIFLNFCSILSYYNLFMFLTKKPYPTHLTSLLYSLILISISITGTEWNRNPIKWNKI